MDTRSGAHPKSQGRQVPMKWIRTALKAIDKITRKPIAALRRRVVRNAAREKLRKNEEQEEQKP